MNVDPTVGNSTANEVVLKGGLASTTSGNNSVGRVENPQVLNKITLNN